MMRSFALVLSLAVTIIGASAQLAHPVFRRTSAPSKMENVQAIGIVVDPAVIKTIVAEKNSLVSLEIPMPQGADLSATLHRFSIVEPSSRFTVMTDDGAEHSFLGADLVWYRATLADGGFVVLTFSGQGDMSGLIDGPGGRLLIGKRRGGTVQNEFVVSRDHDSPYSCGTPVEYLSKELDRLISEAHKAVRTKGELVQAGDTITIEVAIEADYLLVQDFSSKALASVYITELVAALSTVYERELGVKFVITNVRLWDTPNDPYSDTKSVFELLGDFVDLYRATMSAIPRDLAVFVTSRGGQGGIARTIGGICQEDGSYCAGDITRKIAPYPTWSWDVGMFAHEIGHVCGGIHTQSCYWPSGPLDSCTTSESGTCVGSEDTRPTRGTLLSYCHQQIANGATMTLEFHPLHRNVLRSFVQSTPCLGNELRARISRLHGFAVDAITGQPHAGVRLTVRPVLDQILRQTLPPVGDTVQTTASDGSYAFQGLGNGLYEIIVAQPFVRYPISLPNQRGYNGIMIADSVVRHDLKIAKGRVVDLTITNGGDTTPVTLNIFSVQMPDFLTSVQLPFSEAGSGSIKVSQALPVGRYVVVPTAIGRKFNPNKQIVDLVPSNQPMVVEMSSTSASPITNTAIGLGVFEQDLWATPVTSKLFGGMKYYLRNINTGVDVSSGIVPDDGVVVVEDVDANGIYTFGPEIDTNVFTPLFDNAVVFPQWGVTCGTYIQQPRRKPLIVREYSMSVLNTGYEDLVSPNELRSKLTPYNSTTRVNLPYSLRIGDREITTMHVARNGYLTFGPRAMASWVTYPLSQTDQATMIVAPFSAELYPDTTAPTPWRIAWNVVGTEPNRVLNVEWRSMTLRKFNSTNGQSYDVGRFSFQVHIHERGQIDMVYNGAENLAEKVQAEIGLRGNDVLDNQLLVPLSDNDLTDVRARYVPGGYGTVTLQSAEGMKTGLTYRWELPATSVDEGMQHTVTVSPIPVSAHVFVRGLTATTDVRLIDMMGDVVVSTKLNAGDSQLDVSLVAPGRYTLLLTDAGVASTFPLIIMR